MRSLLEAERAELAAFPQTKRFSSLEERYWNKPASIGREVRPMWDFRRSSLLWNWELGEDEKAGCELIENTMTFSLGLKMFRPECYRFPRNFREMDRDKSLLIVDRWLRGIPLTPPVIVFRPEDGTWGKRDGFHRLAIALICLPPEMPVWILNSECSSRP